MAYSTPISLDLHLGDNANFYAGEAKYCGLSVDLPVLITEASDEISLQITTSVIETIVGLGHPVFLNNVLLGTLKDTAGGNAPEVHTLQVPSIVITSDYARLRIECEPIRPSLLDDFILKSIAISGAKLKLGWV